MAGPASSCTRSHAMSMPLHRFLASGDALARLQDHAARLLRLQRFLENALPPALAAASRVANLKGEVLVIRTDSGAVAVRLRQITPSLIEHFAAAGHPLAEIRVRVAPLAAASGQRPPPDRRMSAQAKDHLRDFAATLPTDAPLRAALERLAQRSREGGNEA